MKSTVELLSPTRVRIAIDVTFDELSGHVADAYKKISGQINVPGFRKGKVPQAMIDQRVGRGTVLDEAINAALPVFYSQAAREHDVLVLGRPEVDIKEFVDNEKLSFTVEVSVRPEIALPDFSKIVINVDDVAVTDEDVAEQVDALRARFGTLNTVERDAVKGDFVTIDLVARVDGEEVEGGTATDISYEVGSNRMVDGLDEALIGLKAGDEKVFDTQLVGMQDGKTGAVEVKVSAVKERELPPLDDAFAKLASEFDTLAELQADATERLTRLKKMEQGAQARDLLVEKLLADIEIPVPEEFITAEVDDHLQGEGRMEDADHRAEVDGQVRTSLKSDFLLDAVIKAESVEVTEIELSEYLIRTSARYGMAPEQFAQELSKAGQISQLVAEVARAKGLAAILARITVKDKSGQTIDLEALTPKPEAAVE
ncbi:MAG: trigger factor [Actinobacteria bacterium]|uniref:peptidylprolyl isomerase n=1 Tax=freshwater metagenome TaxID=449393 RepID=A0A6J7I484_9ZZZZ|nr:trigger factor [Actinomycetota bacterium]MSX25343.1 trigger factor [Actinomycetota bacterium]MSY46039.1 trigger factor [Actinomycetota bacterium]MSY57620.1 trigger factor [Actinomycetota bacterium]MTB00725.1 trigger factor [Actinomycetota bacterium]